MWSNENNKIMKKQEIVELIKGEFNPSEAIEIISIIIENKIRFNNQLIFSKEERNEGDTTYLKDRIKELERSKARVINLIREIKDSSTMVKVHSEIHIDLIQQE